MGRRFVLMRNSPYEALADLCGPLVTAPLDALLCVRTAGVIQAAHGSEQVESACCRARPASPVYDERQNWLSRPASDDAEVVWVKVMTDA